MTVGPNNETIVHEAFTLITPSAIKILTTKMYSDFKSRPISNSFV